MKRSLLAIVLLLLLGLASIFTIYAAAAGQENVMVDLDTVGGRKQSERRYILKAMKKNETRRWASISLCWGGDQTIASRS